jgi:DNA topoisomerase-1
LKLPREVGIDPESGKPIVAGFGRFGPYVNLDGTYASLDGPDDVFTIGLNHAVTLIAERKAAGPGRRRGAEPLKDLGKKPDSDETVKVMKGRYGPYVTDGTVNATIPQDSDPMGVTMEEALALIAARAAKGPVKKKKAPAKKASAKKAVKAEAADGAVKAAKPKAKAKAKAKPKAKPAKKAAAE